MAKKKKREYNLVHPSQAVAEAFASIDGLDPINLMKGQRVLDCLSTGVLSLDLIFGGGLQRGRFCTIFGGEHVGKSTLLQEIAVSAQLQGIPVVFLDPETGADPVFMQRQGLRIEHKLSVGKQKYASFYYAQPDTGEDTYRLIMRTLNRMPDVTSGPPTIAFFVDSFAALSSENVDEETGTGGGITPEPRMHSQYLKQIKVRLRKKGGVLVGTNQVRSNIGAYGAPDQETGGKALRFYPDYKLRVSRRSDKTLGKESRDSMGVQIIPATVRTTKNKCFPSWLTVDLQIIPGHGVDKAYDTQQFLAALGFLKTAAGRRSINLKGLDNKKWDLPSFRKMSYSPRNRQKFFLMLQQPENYDRFFEISGNRTYNFDKDYGEDVVATATTKKPRTKTPIVIETTAVTKKSKKAKKTKSKTDAAPRSRYYADDDDE